MKLFALLAFAITVGSVLGEGDEVAEEAPEDVKHHFSLTERGTLRSTCPPGVQFIPHPDDCTQFFHCAHGYAYLKTCPAGLHFDPNLNVCNYPDQVQCSGSTIDGYCPVPVDCAGQHDILLPNPCDCRTFYQCVWGRPVKMPCPYVSEADGLFFNPNPDPAISSEPYCDWADNVPTCRDGPSELTYTCIAYDQ